MFNVGVDDAQRKRPAKRFEAAPFSRRVESDKKRVAISRERRAGSEFSLPLPYCATRSAAREPQDKPGPDGRLRDARSGGIQSRDTRPPDMGDGSTSQFAAQAFQDVVIEVLDHPLAFEAGSPKCRERHALGQSIFGLAEITFGLLGVVAIGQGKTANPSATRIFKDFMCALSHQSLTRPSRPGVRTGQSSTVSGYSMTV